MVGCPLLQAAACGLRLPFAIITLLLTVGHSRTPELCWDAAGGLTWSRQVRFQAHTVGGWQLGGAASGPLPVKRSFFNIKATICYSARRRGGTATPVLPCLPLCAALARLGCGCAWNSRAATVCLPHVYLAR